MVFIGKLAADAAILAFLVPAKAAVGDRFRADELKSAQQGIPFGNEKRLACDRDFDELFVGPEHIRHH